MGTFDVRPVVLSGRLVRLEPLRNEHADALAVAAEDPALFRWYAIRLNGPEDIKTWLREGVADGERGASLPFATIEQRGGRVIGCTRFGNIDRHNLRVEIGWTWLLREWQRTGANREAKYLMLRHAFETWGVRRVEFKTHAADVHSRQALASLGAEEEGTLRKHMVMPDGSARDSVYFSIIDTEWAGIKARLEQRMLMGAR
ncbi:MAG TPA: GNAT family protein [Bryobacteraceae bacterium]